MCARRPVPAFLRVFVRPFSTAAIVLTALLGLLMLVAFSPSRANLLAAILTFYAWVGVGLTWVVSVLALGVVTLGWGRSHLQRTGPLRRWLAPPIIAATCALLIALQVPSTLTLACSRPAMNRLATRFQQTGQITPAPGWIGLYPVRRLDVHADGFRFTITGAGFLDAVGYAYYPATTPPQLGEGHFTPVGGGWYEWIESW